VGVGRSTLARGRWRDMRHDLARGENVRQALQVDVVVRLIYTGSQSRDVGLLVTTTSSVVPFVVLVSECYNEIRPISHDDGAPTK